MTEEKYNKKRNNILRFLYAIGVILAAGILGAAGGAYVDVKKNDLNVNHNKKTIEETCRKVEEYKNDYKDALKGTWNKIEELDDKKVDKREVDNLKSFIAREFGYIKQRQQDIKESINSLKQE